MIRLVTQYTGQTFQDGGGYDGTSGGHCFNFITTESVQYVNGWNNNVYMTPTMWVGIEDGIFPTHLNTLRLWIDYE